MNLLVCGGAGFIGSNFVHYMLKKYPAYKIVVYDKITYAGNLDNLRSIKDKITFIQGDITDYYFLTQIVKKYQIDHVVNFAAETHVDRSIHGGAKDFVLTNTLGVQMLLDVVNHQGLKRMINVSTDEVYGSLDLDSKEKFTENTPIKPNMPYAAAKAGGDMMCHAYYKTHKTPVIVTHCSNNYGPFQFPEKLIPFFIFKLLKGEKVPIYGDGLNVRDWIHVYDHCSALDLLLHQGQIGEVYNIGVDNERNNLEITKLLLKFLGKTEDMIEFITDRPGHDRRYAIDASKIKALGWQPFYTRDKFEQGLEQTVQWYLNNRDWVEKIWSKKRHEMNSWQTKYINNSDNKISSTNLSEKKSVNTSLAQTVSQTANNLNSVNTKPLDSKTFANVKANIKTTLSEDKIVNLASPALTNKQNDNHQTNVNQTSSFKPTQLKSFNSNQNVQTINSNFNQQTSKTKSQVDWQRILDICDNFAIDVNGELADKMSLALAKEIEKGNLDLAIKIKKTLSLNNSSALKQAVKNRLIKELS